MRYKVLARYQEFRDGRRFCKELQFEITNSEIMKCKSLQSLHRYIQEKAKHLGIFTQSEIKQAQFSTETVVEAWKKNQKVEKSLRAVMNLVLERWSLGPTYGLGHWNRVYENGMKLITEEVDPVVVAFFAYLHDSCRIDDDTDTYHGLRASEWIDEIRNSYLKVLTDEQFFKLKEACRLHTIERKTGDPTIDACFDADRLDLWRVGIKPDPEKMATAKGAGLAGQITDKKMKEFIDRLIY